MDSFKLEKLVMKSGLGIKATYVEKVLWEDQVVWVKRTVDSKIARHPDLSKACQPLRGHLAEVYGLFGMMGRGEKGAVAKKQKEFIEDVVQGIEIISISTSLNNDEVIGITIAGFKRVMNNKKIVMVTPFIAFDSEEYPLWADVADCYREIEDEAFKYIYERKYAQMELFDFVNEDKEEAGLEIRQ